MQYKLYYLIDPETQEIRYVGVTKHSLEHRLRGHLEGRSRGNTHKNNWLKSLHSKGLKPEIYLLLSFETEAEVLAAETTYIKYGRELFFDLTNSCDGGKGTLNPSEELRKNQSEGAKKRWANPEKRKNQREASKRQWACSEKRKKMSEAMKGISKPHLWRAILCTTTNTVYLSIAEAAKVLNLHQSNISLVLSGKQKLTKGFHFQYIQQQEAV